jgi:hypothetical protein
LLEKHAGVRRPGAPIMPAECPWIAVRMPPHRRSGAPCVPGKCPHVAGRMPYIGAGRMPPRRSNAPTVRRPDAPPIRFREARCRSDAPVMVGDTHAFAGSPRMLRDAAPLERSGVKRHAARHLVSSAQRDVASRFVSRRSGGGFDVPVVCPVRHAKRVPVVCPLIL